MKKAFDRGRTPRKTMKAVFPGVHKVRDLTLYPFNTLSFMALDRVESPLLAGNVKLRVIDIANALFVLSRTADELERLMGLTDPEFRMACAAWCKGIPPEVVLEAVKVVTQMLGEALSTFVASANPE